MAWCSMHGCHRQAHTAVVILDQADGDWTVHTPPTCRDHAGANS